MIISIGNQKGGVSKTTTTLHLAHALANQGKKVLVIDLDPQSSLTIACGLEPEDISITTYSILCEEMEASKAILDIGNIHIIPSIIDLSVAEIQLAGVIAREYVLKNKLEGVKEYYDFIFIDCPPSLGLLTINALSASDYVLIPTTTEYLALRGMDLLFNTLQKIKLNLNKELEIMGILPAIHDTRTLHSREILEEIKKDYSGIKVFPPIKKSVKVQDAVLGATTILETDPEHEITKTYNKIALEVMGYE